MDENGVEESGLFACEIGTKIGRAEGSTYGIVIECDQEKGETAQRVAFSTDETYTSQSLHRVLRA